MNERPRKASLARARAWKGAQAILFIVATVAIWWLVASMTSEVARCVPWGPAWGQCRPRGHAIVPPNTGLRPLSDRTESALLIVSLLPALWAAQRLLYADHPDAEEETDHQKERGPGPIGRVA